MIIKSTPDSWSGDNDFMREEVTKVKRRFDRI